MKSLRKVIWAEGMFLGQQHFQLWDQYYESYQNLQARSTAPLSWGVLSYDIDEEALENGQFRLSQCQVIFPDGRVVSYDISEDAPLALDLKGGHSEKIDLYICLPANRNASGINGYRDNGALCAWNTDYTRVSDENDPNRQREVMLGRPNLILLSGEESRENFASLQIAELVNDGDDNYTLVEDFIPTSARMNASPRLISMMQSILELFSSKARVLNEQRKQMSAQIATFGHTDVSNFLVLQTLSGAIPVLRHFKDNPQLHPEQLYQLLVRVIGQLCPFSFDIDVHGVPKYRHNDLTKTFDAIEQQMRGLIDVAMPDKMATLQLTKEADLLWSIDNIDSKHLKGNDFYIAVLSPMDDPMWVKHFEKIVKVGARADIEMIVASAMPGVRMVHMQRPPSNLPIKSGYEYFRVERKGDFWKRINSERTLGVYLPKAFRKIKMEIVLVPRD
ncbi:Uncharacterized protein ImpJ/VasE [hydrothermal vent metagenome]|uniref:Uncharacterized protein ImpJ/VasE n=1 Tax=hydrothermal vent metagenome TaxID=652676 RepID=A0A3B1AP65_9ZZZZ